VKEAVDEEGLKEFSSVYFKDYPIYLDKRYYYYYYYYY
jgi:hypothetical protein